jgi:hypothetical protein
MECTLQLLLQLLLRILLAMLHKRQLANLVDFA